MTRTILITLLIVSCITVVGCAFLDKIIPPKYDESGQAIPGSREPTEMTKAVADVVPYGNVALNVLLLCMAGYEKYRSYKLDKGLKATLLAGKQVANDPQMKELWEKVKEAYYKPAHESAGVTSLIKMMIAKLPSVAKG